MIAKATSKAPHAQAAASSGPKSIAMLYWFALFRESSSAYAIMMERRMACRGATTLAIDPRFWCGKPGRSSLMNFISVILLTNSAASGMPMAGTRSSESCPVMVCS